MAQTLTKLRNHVTHSIQGADVPSQLDQDDIINLAGGFLYDAHQWNFRYRPGVPVSFAASQGFVDMPPDFGELVAYEMSDGLNFGVSLTTPQELAELRSTSVTVTRQHFWLTMVQPPQASRDAIPPNRRFEIWPTPTTDQDEVLTLWYRARWQPLVNAADVADVPYYAELPLIECVRALTTGWSERLLEPRGGEFGMLKLVMESEIWQAAVITDGLGQVDYGPMRGGAIERQYPRGSWRSATSGPVGDPA